MKQGRKVSSTMLLCLMVGLLFLYIRVSPPTNRIIMENQYPKVTMVMRFSSIPKLRTQFYCMFLRTAIFFWPQSYGSIAIVLDEESQGDYAFGEKLKQQLKKHLPHVDLVVYYEASPRPDVIHIKGSVRPVQYNRQLFSTFFADNYTTDPIIAYMDTDTQLVMPLTREYLGVDTGKLKVFAEGTYRSWLPSWNMSTFNAVGYPLLVNFMITFPQLLYRDTWSNCRKHILNHTQTTNFEDAFLKFYKPGLHLTPISICLTYAWFHEHDRYDWRFKTQEPDAKFNNHMLPEGNKITANDLIPGLVGVAHVSDRKSWQPQIFTPGYCMSTKAAGMHLKGCENITHDHSLCDYWEPFFRYPWPNAKTWCKAGTMEACCREAMEKHYERVGQLYENKVLDFNKTHVYLIEQIAKEDGITCPHTELP